MTGEPPNYKHQLVLSKLFGKLVQARTYRGDQDTVANGDAHGQSVSLLVHSPRANSQNLGLIQLLDAGLGKEDAAGSLGLGLDALDEDAVQERSEGSDGSN